MNDNLVDLIHRVDKMESEIIIEKKINHLETRLEAIREYAFELERKLEESEILY